MSLTPTTRLTALDGLRGIAVTLVIAYHSLALGAEDHHAFEPFHPGSFGVRLFFVLSGYLITGIFIKARTDAEAADWPLRRVLLAFYLRRVLRIFPVAYLCILVAWLIGDRSVTRYAAWYLTYAQNILFADVGWQGKLTHFWSLAVEEQFYLVWPFLALWLPRRFFVPALCWPPSRLVPREASWSHVASGLTPTCCSGRAVMRWPLEDSWHSCHTCGSRISW